MKLLKYLELNEGIQDKGIFKAVFMAGTPGSGKSYTISKIKSGKIWPRIVNTDKTFPLYKEDWFNNWNKISNKVKTINKNQLALYINSILPLFVDGTSNETSTVLRRTGLLESFGYDCAMIFVNTDLETSLERASKRERKVDPEFIKQVYDQTEKAKSFYKSKFQTWLEINNNEGELTNKVIINAYKKVSQFYDSSIRNPIGKEYKKVMLENGWKYLDPNIKDLNNIKSLVDAWYQM